MIPERINSANNYDYVSMNPNVYTDVWVFHFPSVQYFRQDLKHRKSPAMKLSRQFCSKLGNGCYYQNEVCRFQNLYRCPIKQYLSYKNDIKYLDANCVALFEKRPKLSWLLTYTSEIGVILHISMISSFMTSLDTKINLLHKNSRRLPT